MVAHGRIRSCFLPKRIHEWRLRRVFGIRPPHQPFYKQCADTLRLRRTPREHKRRVLNRSLLRYQFFRAKFLWSGAEHAPGCFVIARIELADEDSGIFAYRDLRDDSPIAVNHRRLYRPFIVCLREQRAGPLDDDVDIGEFEGTENDLGYCIPDEPGDIGEMPDLAVQALDWILGMQSSTVFLGAYHVGQNVLLCVILSIHKLWHCQQELIFGGAPLGTGRLCGVLGVTPPVAEWHGS